MDIATSPFSREKRICVVSTRNVPPKRYGAEKEESDVRKVRSAAPASAGRRSGTVTRQSVRTGPAPSAAAASR
jgi:hypothetical protein